MHFDFHPVGVSSTKLSWQSCQLYYFKVCCRQSIGSTCFLTCCQRSIGPLSCCPHGRLKIRHQSAGIFSVQRKDLSQKIHTTVQPVFVSQKIGRDLKLREAKPPIVNQQCPVSNLNVVSHAVICTNVLSAGCRTQKLFFINWQAFPRQTFFGSKGSYKNFSVLMKCTNEFDCLVYEMFLLTN